MILKDGVQIESEADLPDDDSKPHVVRDVALTLVGLVALGLGALGIALPLLPTTPFVLLAAFAFAQSSEKLHRWLLEHNVFGPLIDNWHRYGAISRRAKIISVVSVVAVSLAGPWYLRAAWYRGNPLHPFLSASENKRPRAETTTAASSKLPSTRSVFNPAEAANA